MRLAITIVLVLLALGATATGLVYHVDAADMDRQIVLAQQNFAEALPVGDPTTDEGRIEALTSDYFLALKSSTDGLLTAMDAENAHRRIAELESRRAVSLDIRTESAAAAIVLFLLSIVGAVWTAAGRRAMQLADSAGDDAANGTLQPAAEGA